MSIAVIQGTVVGSEVRKKSHPVREVAAADSRQHAVAPLQGLIRRVVLTFVAILAAFTLFLTALKHADGGKPVMADAPTGQVAAEV